MNRLFRFGSTLFLILCLSGCLSSAPKTQFYSLFANAEAGQGSVLRFANEPSFGIGPVVLPEFLDNPGVISVAAGNRLLVSSRHAWAGDLRSTVTRVLADDLQRHWQTKGVWAFPWDNRVRPDYQVRIVFEDFSGTRGGKVRVRAKWTLLNSRGDKMLLTDAAQLEVPVNSDSVTDYVGALNAGLNQLAGILAVTLHHAIEVVDSL